MNRKKSAWFVLDGLLYSARRHKDLSRIKPPAVNDATVGLDEDLQIAGMGKKKRIQPLR